MRPSFWRAPVSLLVILACCISMSIPKSAWALGPLDEKTNLEIGAFNIQVFGDSKVNKPTIRSTILSIISRYDIIFIQEIRDDQNLAIYHLLKELNALTGRNYQALVSRRLGRGEMKEQYAYFFDADIIQAVDFYVYNDVKNIFAREPFIGRFRGLGREFTLAGIHVAPTDVRGELRGLGDVHRDIAARYLDNSMFILGDFNADCVYYKPAEGFNFFDEIPKVLIGDDVDTTVSPASCAYDRILGFGDILEHASNGTAYNFMVEMGFNLAAAKLVSDHFPIEFTIAGQSGALLPPSTSPTPMPMPTTAPLPELEGPQVIGLDEQPACGLVPYSTPGGYCYGSFSAGKKRVNAACCAY